MTKEIKIGNRTISEKSPVFVIAEAGVNHNGRLDLALKLIDAAADAGADAVKFQTFKADQVVTPAGKMAKYQEINTGKKESQLDMIRKFELKDSDYPLLIKRAKQKNIIFFSTPHGGFDSVDFLKSLNVPAFKFGSGDLTNLPVLQHAAKFNKPIILGTGMATLEEIKNAIEAIRKKGNNKIVVLQCTTSYPCSLSDTNLNVIKTFQKNLDVLVGYSDHTTDRSVPVMVATLGACVIERHITLDKKLSGPDQAASTEPSEFKTIVDHIRNTPMIMGSFVKKPVKCELQYIPMVRKSIFAAAGISKGERLTKENLAIKRPGNGLEPKYYWSLLGKKAKRSIKIHRAISKKDV